ncbi:HEPN domain-containing protein [Nostoc sp. CMAA1605]|uniref:HEPN domain-containing protein n=1 Tax=Nostoc sp. CMAA1605 TaxID=2055159 RepID=UPI001F2482C3|nr:HEPN domain-containing protein [Nostoc sp. CMAA1605]MCF4966471.1 hypothetical protein [Nostoc sp. CMAA1605]
MNSGNNFEQRILAIDANLALKYPLNKRILQVIKEMYPATYRNILNTDLNQRTSEDISNVFKVYNWYQEKYPNQKNIINSFGYKPFLLNGKIYHILINLDWVSDAQEMQQKLKELIDDMNQLEKDALVKNDLDLIDNEFQKGRNFYKKIHELEMKIEEGSIDAEIIELLAAGIFDINISLSAFRNPFYLDSQPIMFHAQQAVEKFLKSLCAQHKLPEIRRSGKTVDDYVKKNYNHNINKLSQDLKTLLPDFNAIAIKVQELHTEVPEMTIRYKNSGKTIENAIHCIDLMIEICGYVAENFT